MFEINEPSVVSETIDGDVVIINLALGTYFSIRAARGGTSGKRSFRDATCKRSRDASITWV